MLYDSVIKAVIYAVIGHDVSTKMPTKPTSIVVFRPIGTLLYYTGSSGMVGT